MTSLEQYLEGWAPEPYTSRDVILPGPVSTLAAVMEGAAPVPGVGDALPLLWHWLFFLETYRRSELGADGHPTNGRFLPPLPDRTRMFAGGRVVEHAALVIGQEAERRAELGDVKVKRGRSGEMAFVTVRSEISQGGRLRITEEQDLVYRSGTSRTSAPVRASVAGDDASIRATWQRPLHTDPVMLFRFSSVTANAHRIHYDAPYAGEVEGYPDLVVHGPLLAVAMAELVRGELPDRRIRSLSFRFSRPVFVGDPAVVAGDLREGGRVELSVVAASGEAAAGAEAVLA